MAEIPVAHRTLPHNLEAERSVLGSILIDNDGMALAQSVLTAKQFFRDAHRRLFEAMTELADRREPIDLAQMRQRSTELATPSGP